MVVGPLTGEIAALDVVVDLDEHRTRRLARFWPGWWGDHHLATWTAAERSHCGKCRG
jgi:hypothetical protein